MKANLLAGLLGLLLLTAESHANGLRVGHPAVGGNGCPLGTASVTVSPDETALSILFDNYMAEAGGTSGRDFDYKSCNIVIPVHVPQGYSVAIFQLDYRGFNSIPRGGSNQFKVEYFWAGSRGPSVRRVFMGPTNDSFTVTDRLMAETMIWSRCGESVNLRVNSSMALKTNRYQEQAMSIIDTADLSTGLVYHLQWKRCS